MESSTETELLGLEELALRAAAEVTSTKAVYRLLKPTPPRLIDSSRPSEHVIRVVTALCALMHYIYWSSEHTHTIDEVSSQWSILIWPWVSSLQRSFILDREPTTPVGLELQDKILLVVPMIMRFPSHYHDLPTAQLEKLYGRIVDGSPEMVPNTVRTWLYCLQNEHPALGLHSRALRTLEWAQIGDEYVLDGTLPRICSNIPNCMESLLDFIACEAPKRHRARLDALDSALFVISKLNDENEDFFNSFILHRGIRCLATVLEYLSSPRHLYKLGPDHVEHWETSLRCVRTSLKLIIDTINQRGQLAVVQALEGRLLLSMVNSTIIIGYDTDESAPCVISLSHIYGRLLESIKPSLLYHTVWNAFMRSFKQITLQREAYSTFLSMRASDDNDVSSRWKELIAHVASIKKARREYREDSLSVCSNPDCSSNSGQLWKCSRCLTAMYCSKACQRHDWGHHNHREKCESAHSLAKQTGLPPAMTALDDSFFDWLAAREIHERSPELRKRFEKIVKPVVILDFTKDFPVKLKVFSFAECCSDKFSHTHKHPMDDGLLERVSQEIESGYTFVVLTTFPGPRGYMTMIQGSSHLCSRAHHEDGEQESFTERRDEEVRNGTSRSS